MGKAIRNGKDLLHNKILKIKINQSEQLKFISIEDSLKIQKQMGMENLNGLTEDTILVTFIINLSQVMVNLCGSIKTKESQFIKELSQPTFSRVKASYYGLMGIFMKAILKMGNITVKVNLIGLTLNLNIKVNLRKEKCMALGFSKILSESLRVNSNKDIQKAKLLQTFIMAINIQVNL